MPCGASQLCNAPKAAIDEIDQGDEGNQHGGDVECQVQSIDRAARNCAEDVDVALDFGHFDAAGRERFFRFGDEDFCEEDGSGRGHDDGCQKMLGLMP